MSYFPSTIHAAGIPGGTLYKTADSGDAATYSTGAPAPAAAPAPAPALAMQAPVILKPATLSPLAH
jgi:hypothetical protein